MGVIGLESPAVFKIERGVGSAVEEEVVLGSEGGCCCCCDCEEEGEGEDSDAGSGS